MWQQPWLVHLVVLQTNVPHQYTLFNYKSFKDWRARRLAPPSLPCGSSKAVKAGTGATRPFMLACSSGTMEEQASLELEAACM
jgi:hypothetical protein